ncbi:MAG: molybdate ABC transporter substrate-binding protein [Mycobacteriales bacterium]
MSRRPVVAAAVLAVVLAGCGTHHTAKASSSTTVKGTVTVLAAASLTGTLTRLGKDFEAAHHGVRVRFSFGASSTLAQQVAAGAPADVFAAASPATMKRATGARDPVVFARNQLVIAVPPGNPQGIHRLADLARPGVKLALCAEQVPCGAAARTALAAAHVTVHPATLEQDVKATLTKLTLGEVDAALVYRTDAKAAGNKVTAVEFPESRSAINDYPIAVLGDAPNPAGARAFVAYVRSARGRDALSEAGFQPP